MFTDFLSEVTWSEYVGRREPRPHRVKLKSKPTRTDISSKKSAYKGKTNKGLESRADRELKEGFEKKIGYI